MAGRAFFPRLDILPPPQHVLWDELGATPPEFTLYGGTAIALRLGHRQSVDFDFFGASSFDADRLLMSTPYLADAAVVQRTPDTLTVRVNRDGPVLVSYFSTPSLGEIETPTLAPNGLKVASLIDLAALKTVVVQKRAEAKDFIDIDALIRNGVLLQDALAAARIIQGATFNPQVSLKALSYFGDGDLASLDGETRIRIQSAVARVDAARLPDLAFNRAYGEPRR